MGVDFRDCLKPVWKMTYFVLKGGQDLKNPSAHPQKEFSGVPSPSQPLTFTHNDIPYLFDYKPSDFYTN